MAGRELIDTNTDEHYVRRDNEGKFCESDDVGTRLPVTFVSIPRGT